MAGLTGAEIDLVDNPRKEAPENELAAENQRLLGLGLKPTPLEDDLLREVTEVASVPRPLDPTRSRARHAGCTVTATWTTRASISPDR